jgi:hypothetical protein
VNAWLLRSPWWVLSLVTGAVFGVLMALFGGLVQGEGWPAAAAGGAVSGVLFGLVMGPLLARMNRRFTEAVGNSSDDQLRRARRAVRGGPVPEDAADRALAYRLATTSLADLRRRRWSSGVVFTLFTALLVVAALTQSPWYWVVAGLSAGMVAVVLMLPRRLERRAALLAPPGGGTAR